MYQFEKGSDIHHASITSLNVLRGLDALLLNMEKDLAESGQITNLHRCIWELTQEVPHRRTLIIAHDHALEAQEKIASIRASIKTISALTDRLNQQGDIPVPGDEGSWHFGKLTIVGSVEPFLRGHLERREVIPLVSDLPRSVALFLVSVPTTRDYVEREIHNGQWGYHYHYLDAKKRRSDTLLTFDAASPPNTQPKLCWEPHAETHTISARPEAWGSKKRESVYSVCFPDTTKWPLSVFKRPATNASPVWPVNPPSVTPRTTTMPAQQVPASHRRRN